MSHPPYIPVDDHGLLGDLNEAQRTAVTHADSPLLLVAGAGTGKTRVLTRRVAWLVHRGLEPWRVLAITFTNKAADELGRRLGQLPGGEQVWAGTFHRFGSFLLRRHGDEIGIDTGFTILDRDDQMSIVRAIYKDLDLDTGVLRPVDALAGISHRKNGGGGRAPVDLTMQGVAATFDAVHDAYVERLRNADLLDFDDLLLDALRLLQEREDVAAQYRQRFAHVLVDEYQDTNLVQRDLLMELVGEEGLITVVGDPDQSIYRWRGAAVRNILDFDDHFPGTRMLLLERNYRSTAHILAAAEAVIERNRERHAKRLFTEQGEGKPVRVIRARDGEDEGRLIAQQVARWQEEGRRLDDIAIFYRVNAMSRGIEMALNQSGIPYVVVAGTEFFQRREVKDVLAYARLVINPKDEAAFLRVVNTPRRGVGAASLAKLRTFADAHGLSLPEAGLRAEEAGVSKRAANGIKRFVAVLERARAMPRAPVAPILDALLDGSGYRANLEDSEDDLDRSRLENVQELVAYAREFLKREPEGDLPAFLERAALVSDQDGYEALSGRVTLMSVHAAKGLEFPCVIIAGAELGYFPHGRNLGDAAAEEEERRLFYVAMTRAEEELVITHAAQRSTYMGEERRVASPYVGDIPAGSVDHEDRATSWGGGGWGRPQDRPGSFDFGHHDDAAGHDLPPEEDVVRESTGTGLSVGERVMHPYFGPGVLESIGGGGADTRVTVDFDTHGVKQLLLRHARLERLT